MHKIRPNPIFITIIVFLSFSGFSPAAFADMRTPQTENRDPADESSVDDRQLFAAVSTEPSQVMPMQTKDLLLKDGVSFQKKSMPPGPENVHLSAPSILNQGYMEVHRIEVPASEKEFYPLQVMNTLARDSEFELFQFGPRKEKWKAFLDFSRLEFIIK